MSVGVSPVIYAGAAGRTKSNKICLAVGSFARGGLGDPELVKTVAEDVQQCSCGPLK